MTYFKRLKLIGSEMVNFPNIGDLQSTSFHMIPPNFVTHFEPKEEFLKQLAEYIGDQFVIEVGAGQCHFTQAMHRHKIKAMAIEPRPSDETRRRCMNFLYPMSINRSRSLLKEKSVVIVARPDHSGWVRTIPDYIHPESELFYIGLEKNLDVDIPEEWTLERVFSDVGEDGEHMWKVHYADV